MIDAYGDEFKEDVFIDRLSSVSPKEIIRTAKERRAGSMGYAEAMLIYYNKRTRNPLQWDKLYAHKKRSSAWMTLEEAENEDNTGNTEGNEPGYDELELL